MKAYYDAYWNGKRGGEGWRLDPVLRAEMARGIGPRDGVLDVGCGDGRHYGTWLRERAGAYLGLDISEVAVGEARRRGLEARVHDLSQPLPLASGCFSVAVCLELLEHIFDPEFLLREVQRVLAPGGRLIASVPNSAHWVRRYLLLRGRFDPGGDPGTVLTPWHDPHIRFFTRASFLALLRHTGYARPVCRGLAPYPRWMRGAWPEMFSGHLLAVASKDITTVPRSGS